MTRDTDTVMIPFHLSVREQDGGIDVGSVMYSAERRAIIVVPSVCRVRSVES